MAMSNISEHFHVLLRLKKSRKFRRNFGSDFWPLRPFEEEDLKAQNLRPILDSWSLSVRRIINSENLIISLNFALQKSWIPNFSSGNSNPSLGVCMISTCHMGDWIKRKLRADPTWPTFSSKVHIKTRKLTNMVQRILLKQVQESNPHTHTRTLTHAHGSLTHTLQTRKLTQLTQVIHTHSHIHPHIYLTFTLKHALTHPPSSLTHNHTHTHLHAHTHTSNHTLIPHSLKHTLTHTNLHIPTQTRHIRTQTHTNSHSAPLTFTLFLTPHTSYLTPSLTLTSH